MENIKFVYDEPAAVIRAGGEKIIVIGDLHIGMEKQLLDKGIRLHNSAEMMARKVSTIARRFKAKQIAIIGDIKESILYPDTYERAAVQRFFGMLGDYRVTVTRGNHDPHLGEIISADIADELIIGKFALLHGNRWPSEKAIGKEWLLTAHNHMAVAFAGKPYTKEKAWLISSINKENASKKYRSFNAGAKLVMFPAFNELIIGRAANEQRKGSKDINPLLSNNVFDYREGRVYSLKGEFVGTLGKLAYKEK